MQVNMSKTFSLSLLSLCVLLHPFWGKCSSPLAPALYIFGDSLIDSGNNNFLATLSKANYAPYGIDFPQGPTGRFTNGNTFVDFLAQFLGLPFAPPYLGLSVAQKSNTTTGINFASGSAGILTETGTAMGMNLALQEQIKLFQETVNLYLPGNFKTEDELMEYLSNSIFVVDIGSNDYINNYLLPEQYTSSHLYSPEQFANILLKELKRHLQDLYNLGARKFLVFNIADLGCTPGIIIRENITSGCAEEINQLAYLYDEGFPSMIQNLSTSLENSTFVQGDIYESSLALGHNPFKSIAEAGLLTDENPCCTASNSTFLCFKDVTPCLDRTVYSY
ncbi:GDSL esterase/lipase 7-like [Macadamia integrifolia]|uniref:GDSL esterase/lipase 7-like n=1 Tax=Macadamia integrifolia TaxID=60698 RepID=UPI001C4E9BAF|nr:GDSL esterase/lipase 7-like [Macadamia integrifolia]